MRTHSRANPAPTHFPLMLALTCSTGVIDAVGYLAHPSRGPRVPYDGVITT